MTRVIRLVRLHHVVRQLYQRHGLNAVDLETAGPGLVRVTAEIPADPPAVPLGEDSHTADVPHCRCARGTYPRCGGQPE